MPTIPWSESSLDRLSRNYYRYKSEGFGLNSETSGHDLAAGSSNALTRCSRAGDMLSMASGQMSFEFNRPDELFVWVWNNVTTRDKMRRKSLANIESRFVSESSVIRLGD